MRPKAAKSEVHLSMTEVKGMLQATTESSSIAKLEDKDLLIELQKRGYQVNNTKSR